MIRLVIDTDPGVDDAPARSPATCPWSALQPTPVPWTTLDPLIAPPNRATELHGEDGLGDINRPSSERIWQMMKAAL